MTMLAMDPGETMTAIAFFASAAISIKVIAAAVLRSQENRLKADRTDAPGVNDQRLERIEHAMDAIAIEVERISEAQRFTTRLLAERTADPDRVPR